MFPKVFYWASCLPEMHFPNPSVAMRISRELKPMLCDNLEGWDGIGVGMGWEVGGRFKRKGTYVYLWLFHVDVWKKQTQYYKAIILQLKIKLVWLWLNFLWTFILQCIWSSIMCWFRVNGGNRLEVFLPLKLHFPVLFCAVTSQKWFHSTLPPCWCIKSLSFSSSNPLNSFDLLDDWKQKE